MTPDGFLLGNTHPPAARSRRRARLDGGCSPGGRWEGAAIAGLSPARRRDRAQRLSTGALYADTCAPSEIRTSALYRRRWLTRITRVKRETVGVPGVTIFPPTLTE